MSIFTKVRMPKVGSNVFDLSHDVKMSFNMGQLIPSLVMDVVPGDKFNMSVEKMLRFQPLASPMMHKCNVTCHFFFVPNRILWPEWEDFITGEQDILPPYFASTEHATGSLADYIGVPTMGSSAVPISAFPFAAYLKIFDEYYRDQNLQDEKFIQLESGNNLDYVTIAQGDPLKRAWMHDYFTSCLPFAQKGDEVSLPLLQEDTIPVELKLSNPGVGQKVRKRIDDTEVNTSNNLVGSSAGVTHGADQVNIDPNGTLEVDINAEASTINTLRRAFRLQEWLEKNARGGTRYVENILAHFGVRSSDKRLQRPEYIGGSKGNMTISEVLSTAQTVDQSSNDVPIGQLAGHGIGVSGGNKMSYRAEEHGWIIGILNVQPVTSYHQGLPRMFSRQDKLDYYWPSFANIGEQAVLNQEIYAAETSIATLNETFGYIPRYSEYKYMNNRIAGDFKTNLAYWHLGRIFSNTPTLNSDFIEADPDHRVFAVTDPDEHKVLAHVFNNIKAIRKMPKYGNPTI